MNALISADTYSVHLPQSSHQSSYVKWKHTLPQQRGPQICVPQPGRTWPRAEEEGFGEAGLCAAASPTFPQALSC